MSRAIRRPSTFLQTALSTTMNSVAGLATAGALAATSVAALSAVDIAGHLRDGAKISTGAAGWSSGTDVLRTMNTTAPEDTRENATIRVAEARACTPDRPAVFRGDKHDFILTRPEDCEQLRNTIPAVYESRRLNDQMTLTGLPDGTFQFRLQHDNEDIIVTPRNFLAIMEAWQVSRGQGDTPLPITFLMAKWRLESRLGNMPQALTSSACGMNQFMPGTLAQAVVEFGPDHGYSGIRTTFLGISRSVSESLNYSAMIRAPAFDRVFNDVCADPSLSAILGVRNTIRTLRDMEQLVAAGRITLPEGRTYLTATDAYIGHFFGTDEAGVINFYRTLAQTPDKPMNEVVSALVYAQNDYFFERDDAYTNAQGQRATRTHVLTAREFYNEEIAQRWGFGFDQLPSMLNWQPADYVASGTVFASRSTPNATNGMQAFHMQQQNFPHVLEANQDVRLTIRPAANPN
jgi:hypothetical protein